MSLKWQHDKKWRASHNAPMTAAEKAAKFRRAPVEEFPDDDDLALVRAYGEHLDEEAGR